ncbi:MAG TPA: antibiotic biosynthesis monooxygenase [Chitinophagaceae bacterium]|nr:antibiotic biosynthesis monooxygenase [Chitinophagaceae bacterium]
MDKLALMVTMQAKKGKESEIEKLLSDAVPVIEEERKTSTWQALRLGSGTFIILDTFPDEESRQAHLSGKLAKTLMARTTELFEKPITIEKLDIVAVKMPEVIQY